MYSQSLKSLSLEGSRDAKRGRTDEQGQPRIKKRDPNRDVPSPPKANYERGGGSDIDKTYLLKLWEETFWEVSKRY